MDGTATAETGTQAPTTTTTPAASAQATAAPAPASFDWKGLNLAPDLQQVVDHHQFKDPGMVVQSYSNLMKLHGVPAEQIIKLPKTADAKEWNEVYSKLGRPETADKYVIPVPEGDKGEFAGVAKAWFHEAGVSQSQATKLAEKWNGYLAEQSNTATAKQTQDDQISVNELKQAWGGEYEAKAALVDKAAEEFGMTQPQLTALKQVLGPKGAMQFLHGIGAKIASEDTTVPGMGSKGGFTMSPEQAQAAIAAKRADPLFAQLFSSSDPKQRMEARAEMDRLTKLAHPGSTMFSSGSQATT